MVVMIEKIKNKQRNDISSLSREERAIKRAPFEKAQKREVLFNCALLPMTGDFGLSRASIVSLNIEPESYFYTCRNCMNHM
jgi:hypothetical protein